MWSLQAQLGIPISNKQAVTIIDHFCHLGTYTLAKVSAHLSAVFHGNGLPPQRNHQIANLQDGSNP